MKGAANIAGCTPAKLALAAAMLSISIPIEFLGGGIELEVGGPAERGGVEEDVRKLEDAGGPEVGAGAEEC